MEGGAGDGAEADLGVLAQLAGQLGLLPGYLVLADSPNVSMIEWKVQWNSNLVRGTFSKKSLLNRGSVLQYIEEVNNRKPYESK